MELLRTVTRAGGKTVVVVTHDARIFHFADRILHLEDGRVTAVTGNDEDIINPDYSRPTERQHDFA
jgi:putative ABC transport system ATP-binding protein